MALSQQLVHKQTQKIIITQELRQSIELLPMSNLELAEKIQKEVLENPMLEMAEDARADAPEPVLESTPAPEEPRVSPDDDNFNEYSAPEEFNLAAGREAADKKNQFLQNQVRTRETLADHLMWQIRMADLTPAQVEAAEFLISSIDERGYLREPAEELIKDTDITLANARSALRQIKRCDPIGCGAVSVVECLIAQVEILYPDDSTVLSVLQNHFESLEKLDFKKLERAGFSEIEVDHALKVIRSLEPYPGTLYSDVSHDYIVPDMSVEDVDGRTEVFVEDEWIPELKINEEYRDLMKTGGKFSGKFSGEDREYLQSKLNAASVLIKSIRQRRHTMIQVMRSIIRHQEAFFKSGPGNLRPLTLREIAADVELHESTISRITTNKYVQTRWGIFELKHFFSSSLRNTSGGDDHSARNIKERIQKLVQEEKSPLSDQDIVQVLKNEGVEIARRTVAKYRKILKILPADRRKKLQGLKQQSSQGTRQ
jgi:RNA polymerase sigma-54 factor